MAANDEMIIKFNSKNKHPYEVWLDGQLVDTFVTEETAKEMCKLQVEIKGVYMKNQYEKFVLHRDSKSTGCLHAK